ncbi:hypothetical protein PIN31115_05500 [Pandoraea iniqua]|uniref:Uncharacterized protein n=1 Tax=Pandoraea iniqua TaxID=2508288 RepID=A0A5E4ZF21_9BURK|nr:hypothetical protein [Pandoraea iniqua]VVE59267.1 hypothetical protein PIN31115_05500 [Pandoraea iniqua]
MHIGKWLTAALAATTGMPINTAPASDFADAFVAGTHPPPSDAGPSPPARPSAMRRASVPAYAPTAAPTFRSTLAPASVTPSADTSAATSPSTSASPSTSTAAPSQPYDWSRPPITRAAYLAEQLAAVPPVCVVGSLMDSGDCLLDVPAGERTYVRVSELMRRGCEKSLPERTQAALSIVRRDADALEAGFEARFASESQGRYATKAIAQRLRERIGDLTPELREALAAGTAYIEVPRLTFQRVVRGTQEAQRNNLFLRIPDRDVPVPAGDALTDEATLGAFIRIPGENGVRTLLVSLSTRATVEPVRHDPMTYTGLHIDHLFGDVPEYYLVGRIHMQKLAAGDDLVHTLSKRLHEGHRRYRDFAYGKTREQVARNSHADVRQPLCEPRRRRLSRTQLLFRRVSLG